MKWASILSILYLVFGAIFGVFLGGAGHGPGIQILYLISLPSSLLGGIFPSDSVMIWIAVTGFFQWLLIGLAIDWIVRRKKSKGRLAKSEAISSR